MKHRIVDVRGTRIHCVEEGAGPLVLLVHGFPESWYSWRHQLPVIAEAGFRAVAIDVRGYGRSSAPVEVEAYGMVHHVGDTVGVAQALAGTGEQAIVIGHDWGSPIAAHSALLRPDVFRAVALLSVPYNAPGGPRPTEAFAKMGELAGQMTGQEEEFYINYFQEPGRAEREFEADVRTSLYKFYVSASADSHRSVDGGTTATVAKGKLLLDRVTLPDEMPGWLTEVDLDFYTEQFEYSGFRGPLNRYRNVDRDWLDLRAWTGAPIRQPSLFIGGDRDGPVIWGQNAIKRFPESMPASRGTHILDNCGHWVQQEKPDEVNRLLLDWLASL
ncbi:MAG TPA: alpha/beta hydrolase [Mycobacteriales bacterium]|nr:alpha/beta hydrolase [Mycobacteriales bacterium]